MDKFERRRLRLMRTKDEKYGGNIAAMARALGISDSYVHRMLYEEGRLHKKRIGEESVELIQQKLGVDLDAPDVGEAPTKPPASTRRLQWVDDEESALLSDFRATDDAGRFAIKAVASEVPKSSFEELAAHEPKSGSR